jgi:toxin-antitoxin system PIN domain toxin
MIPDVNVLVSAARLEHPHHKVALDWLQNSVDSARTGDRLGLLPAVIAGFLRITTNAKIFPSPTPIEAAIKFIDGLLQCPGVVVLSSGSEWSKLRALCVQGSLVANAIPDAWIAALVLHHGDTLATFDRDFIAYLPQKQVLLLRS